MDKPFVSVVIPVYNAKDTIGLCLESVLAQDYPADRYEVLAVDNNSTDSSAHIIRSYPVTYLREDKIQSPSGARNKGVRNAKGDIIAFIDSDCIAVRDWISQGVKSMRDKSLGAVGGKITAYKPTSYLERYQDRAGILWHVVDDESLAQAKARLVTANAFFRKSIFAQVGLFDTIYKGAGEDTDISYAIQRQTNFTIAYNHHAAVYHKHRTTLYGFWKQQFRYGYNNILLHNKYDPFIIHEITKDVLRFGYLKSFYWRLRNEDFFNHIKTVFKMLAKYVVSFSNDRKTAFFDSFLFASGRCAASYGEYKAFRDHHDLLFNNTGDKKV